MTTDTLGPKMLSNQMLFLISNDVLRQVHEQICGHLADIAKDISLGDNRGMIRHELDWLDEIDEVLSEKGD